MVSEDDEIEREAHSDGHESDYVTCEVNLDGIGQAGGPAGLMTTIHCTESVLASGGVMKLYEARDAFAKGGATFERAQIVHLDARWIASCAVIWVPDSRTCSFRPPERRTRSSETHFVSWGMVTRCGFVVVVGFIRLSR